MKKLLVAALMSAFVVASAHAQINVPGGFESAALGQNFGGGFDYLPNGDIIGMYVDPNMGDPSYVGIIDANGDGDPATVNKVHDFGAAIFGSFCKVSPDGSIALFVDSAASPDKVYSMALDNYDVSDVALAGGSFDGWYDLAFIDSSRCYVSANPGGLGVTTNKIMHLNLNTGVLKDVIAINNTPSGAIDVDNDGNLYYVKSTYNWPAQPGDFRLFSFTAAKLASVLAGAPVLGEGDGAKIIALDGGNDVAWHISGLIYVSDANNGKLYQVQPLSDFAILGEGIGGGFTHLAFFERDEAFDANTSTQAKLAAGYTDDWGGSTPSNVYQINPIQPDPTPTPTPPLGVEPGPMSAGSSFTFIIYLAQDINDAFDYYLLADTQFGAYTLYLNGEVEKGITALYRNIQGFKEPFVATIIPNVILPMTMGGKDVTFYTAAINAGTMPPVSSLSELTATTLNVILMDKKTVTVAQ